MFGRRISALLVFAFTSLLYSTLYSTLCPAVQAGSTVVIQNGDSAGVGFNDPTPASPVGGNTGATLGQQRMIAIQAAANKWGATLDSVPTITARVTWNALSCAADSAELAATGAQSAWHDFAGAKVSGTWYPAALANALARAIDPVRTGHEVPLFSLPLKPERVFAACQRVVLQPA
jgi:hypothetical protein